MSTSSLMRSVVPSDGLGTPGVLGRREVPKTIARLESLRRKIEESRAEKNKVGAADLHREAAPIVAEVLDGYGKDLAAASCLGETKQHVGDLRSGARGAAAWQLFALLADSREAWLALCRIFCPLHDLEQPQPRRRGLTAAELFEEMLGLFAENPALLGLLQQRAALRRGAEPEDVLRSVRERAPTEL